MSARVRTPFFPFRRAFSLGERRHAKTSPARESVRAGRGLVKYAQITHAVAAKPQPGVWGSFPRVMAGRVPGRRPTVADHASPHAPWGSAVKYHGYGRLIASPMRCTRSALVLPGLPGGLPATMTILSPIAQRLRLTRVESTTWTMSSVWCTVGEMNVSTPQVRASWLRVAGSVVNASSGIGERYLASRRAVSPVIVNATRARAPTIAPTSAVARAIAPPVVVGIRDRWCSARSEDSSAAATILLIVATVSTG